MLSLYLNKEKKQLLMKSMIIIKVNNIYKMTLLISIRYQKLNKENINDILLSLFYRVEKRTKVCRKY